MTTKYAIAATRTDAVASVDSKPVIINDLADRLVKVDLYSFGYLWGGPQVELNLTIDLRKALYNPHRNPAMVELTGLDPEIYDYVMATAGANEIAIGTLMTIQGMLPGHDNDSHGQGNVVRVGFGCAGGRHRSVVLANHVFLLLQQLGIGSNVCHEHVMRPVWRRDQHAAIGS